LKFPQRVGGGQESKRKHAFPGSGRFVKILAVPKLISRRENAGEGPDVLAKLWPGIKLKSTR